MNIIPRIIVALFLIFHAPLQAGDAVPSPEALNAFNEFTSFLNKEVTRTAQSGISLGPSASTLPEARKRCYALIAAAKGRKDIADAARMTLQAYSYVVTNWSLAKAHRKVPEDKVLADLMALNQSGPTEGQMMKCYQVALIRLTQHFGKPSITEDEVMRLKDVDFASIVTPMPSPAENARGKALPAEITVAVAADGSLKLNDKALTKQELVVALTELKAGAKASGQEILLTISADGRSKYERVTEVLDAASQAGVTDVAFQEMVEQDAAGQPATRPASKPEGGDKAEGRSR